MSPRPLLAAAAAASFAGCGSEPAQENRGANAPLAANSAAPAPKQAPAPAPADPGPPAAVPTGPFSPSGYALNGTEPFWGGTVTGTRVRYMTPENQFGTVVETSRTLGASEVYRGSLGGRPFVLTLSRTACSDGLSDRSYQFTAVLEVRGETRRGCADPE